MTQIISFIVALFMAMPSFASSRWRPVRTVVVAPYLVARVKIDSRSYSLYRDPRTQGFYLDFKGRKRLITKEQGNEIRHRAVNLAWKTRYVARHSKVANKTCATVAGEIIVPATDDRVRICRSDDEGYKGLRELVSSMNKTLTVNIARR